MILESDLCFHIPSNIKMQHKLQEEDPQGIPEDLTDFRKFVNSGKTLNRSFCVQETPEGATFVLSFRRYQQYYAEVKKRAF